MLLGDICDVRDGTHDSPKAQKHGYPLITSRHLKNNKVDFSSANLISLEDFEAVNKRSKVNKNDILISMIGTIGELAFVDKDPNFAIKNIGLIKTNDGLLGRYIYYYLQSPAAKQYLNSVLAGSTQRFVSLGQLRKFPILLPQKEVQEKIIKIFGELDRKIELNRQMNETLEQMGQALFKYYFINNPEVKEWETILFSKISQNYDSKRVPLSSRVRKKRKGEFRYYGATSILDYVDNYIFDGLYLLIAEDGSVVKEDGTPVLQYVWGKFWVNNHAHIVQARHHFSVEYLYLLLKNTNIRALISGAVQLKINQKALNSLKIKQPPNKLLSDFNFVNSSLFRKIRTNSEEIDKLTTLRESLLPYLMSGRMRI